MNVPNGITNIQFPFGFAQVSFLKLSNRTFMYRSTEKFILSIVINTGKRFNISGRFSMDSMASNI